MYSLISSGKVIGTAETFAEACERAAAESKTDRGCRRLMPDGTESRGCIISVWSGPIVPYVEGSKSVRGVTKHASFACGSKF